jgi:hypothetical protein
MDRARPRKRPRVLRREALILFMVRLAGFEPTTPWFVAKYSIQLSYSRLFSHVLGSTLAVRPEEQSLTTL